MITLCINVDEEAPPAAVSIVQSFIQRSSCSLSTLIIRPSCFRGTEFLCLPCLEGLVTLHFTVNLFHLESHCRDITFSNLASTSILPHVSTLVVDLECTSSLNLGPTMDTVPSWATLIDILERRHAATKLQTFRIIHEYGLPSWMVRDLSALSQRSGLHIEYTIKNFLPPGFFQERDFLTSEIWYRS